MPWAALAASDLDACVGDGDGDGEGRRKMDCEGWEGGGAEEEEEAESMPKEEENGKRFEGREKGVGLGRIR